MEAHPLSVSRSELRLEDGLARLEIRLPRTELEHMSSANRDLPRLFVVAGEGPASKRCQFEGNDLVCRATYLAPHPLEVESRLPEAVLPHHIHTLTYNGRNFLFTTAVIRHNLESSTDYPSWLWAVGVLALAVAALTIRSLRSRRNRLASS